MTNTSSIQNSEDLPIGMTFTRHPIDDPYKVESHEECSCDACIKDEKESWAYDEARDMEITK